MKNSSRTTKTIHKEKSDRWINEGWEEEEEEEEEGGPDFAG